MHVPVWSCLAWWQRANHWCRWPQLCCENMKQHMVALCGEAWPWVLRIDGAADVLMANNAVGGVWFVLLECVFR